MVFGFERMTQPRLLEIRFHVVQELWGGEWLGSSNLEVGPIPVPCHKDVLLLRLPNPECENLTRGVEIVQIRNELLR